MALAGCGAAGIVGVALRHFVPDALGIERRKDEPICLGGIGHSRPPYAPPGASNDATS